MSSTRRDFLKATVGAAASLSLSSAIPSFMTRTALAAARAELSDRVLVVVQLSGGNDGLNTVVPFGDDAYGRNRRTLRLTGADVHKVDELVGFHPQMPGFAELFQEGQLSVVQGIGYPKNNRDHDGAMRDWHTARPGESNCQTGWLGRTLDVMNRVDAGRVPAALIASIPQPFALNAQATVVPSITEAQRLITEPLDAAGAQRDAAVATAEGPAANELTAMIQQRIREANAMSQRVQEVLSDPQDLGNYPSYDLAQQFQVASQLIRANLGIQVLFTESGNGGGGIGGFDNHANQRDNHASLLRELSASMKAFVDDLAQQGLLDRVLIMTFSEFGRTLAENGRRGTGHGAAAPVFLAGGSLRGGFVGDRPSLTDLEGGAPKPHTDYRQLYASVLEQWLQLDSQPILGANYTPLELFA